MIASGYTLDLYCDNEKKCRDEHFYFGVPQGQFLGETWADTVKQAKAAGWYVSKKKRVCYCPECGGKELK